MKDWWKSHVLRFFFPSASTSTMPRLANICGARSFVTREKKQRNVNSRDEKRKKARRLNGVKSGKYTRFFNSQQISFLNLLLSNLPPLRQSRFVVLYKSNQECWISSLEYFQLLLARATRVHENRISLFNFLITFPCLFFSLRCRIGSRSVLSWRSGEEKIASSFISQRVRKRVSMWSFTGWRRGRWWKTSKSENK